MSKIYCTNICQYRIGEVCGRETVNITSYGCHSRKCVSGQKESTTWSTNPWENYTPPTELVEEYKQRARILLKEDKISNNDVNQDT